MGKVVHCIHRQDLSTAYAFPSSMVCYKSVTHSERSDVLSVRLRISHTYGCLSQDMCLDCCTSNLSISWRERWWFGVHEANSTKWESQQYGNNNLKKPVENTMVTKIFGFLFHVNIWCIQLRDGVKFCAQLRSSFDLSLDQSIDKITWCSSLKPIRQRSK